MRTRLRAAAHEITCTECRITWTSWLQRLLHIGGMTPHTKPCPETFSHLGPAYQCVHPTNHPGRHRDQHDNTWGRQ
jgi:hypothetical protein